MSLIADALKRAQEQRRAPRDDGARRLLTPSGPLRVRSRGGGPIPRSLGVAGFALAFAVVVFALAVILSPRSEIRGAMALAASPAPGAAGEEVSPREPLELPELRLAEGEASAAARGPSDRFAETGTSAAFDGREARSAEPAAMAAAEPAGAGTRSAGEMPSDGDARSLTDQADAAEPSSFRLSLSGGGAAADLGARALSAQRQGDHERAAGLYLRALELQPSDPQLHNNLGTVYRALGAAGMAHEAFSAAVAADPAYAPAWSNLGMMLDALGRGGEAEEAYRTALRLDPSNAGARVNLANAYAERGLRDQALTLLRTALDHDPALPEAHYAMARLLDAAQDAAGASRHYTAFLAAGEGRFAELEARVRERLAELAGASLR